MTKVLPPSPSLPFPSSIPPSSLHLSFERGITLDLIRVIPYLPSGKEAETIYTSGCHDAHYLRQEDLKYGSSWLIKSMLSLLTHAGKEGHKTPLCPIFFFFENWRNVILFIYFYSWGFLVCKISEGILCVCVCVCLKVAFAHPSSQMMLSFYLPFYFMCEKVKPQALMFPFPLLHLMLN